MDNIYHYLDDDIYFVHSYDAKPNPADFKSHTHEKCELYYFISGKGKYHIEGSEYPLSSGDILIMRSTESHYIEIDPRYPYERIAVHFSEKILRDVDPNGKLLSVFADREAGKGNLFTTADFGTDNFKLYLRNMTYVSRDQRLQIITGLLPLLNELYNAATNRSDHSTPPESNAYRIIRYVNEHLYEELSLDTICKEFYISKPQLCRIFKRATGSTVWEYVTTKRLIAAQRLIRSGIPVAEAARKCGFGDYTSFYRAYRKQFGEKPKEAHALPT